MATPALRSSDTCACGGVHGGAREVRAHHLGRHDDARVALDLQALHRVEGVARPDAVGVLEDAEVDASAARRARLDLEVGVAALERGEQAVERLDVVVHPGAPRVGGAGLEQVAVVVPLQVGDVVVARAGCRAARAGTARRPRSRGRARTAVARARAARRARGGSSRGAAGRARCRG